MPNFKLLTGPDVHEAFSQSCPAQACDWELLSPTAQHGYEEMAATLNAKLKLCEGCGQRSEHLHEVAGNMLCGPCIAPPTKKELKQWRKRDGKR